ncbi:GGDEF domain-containing protein [Marinobacter oulmenensis]|uniref:diguanylate cyclase n=1 Tax=Marinobacter oulmenensis TaxID=643747 RepID=A0A840UGR2_9GAMM|nr:diguanylate cyclase (GGDEF)-like protein [Marinobacter oulmenensis]
MPNRSASAAWLSCACCRTFFRALRKACCRYVHKVFAIPALYGQNRDIPFWDIGLRVLLPCGSESARLGKGKQMEKTGDLSFSEPDAESGRNGLLEKLPLLMMEALSSIQQGEHLTGILPEVLREVEKYLPAACCRLYLADELFCAQPLSTAACRSSAHHAQHWLTSGYGCEAWAGDCFPLYSSVGKLSGTLQIYWYGHPDPAFASVLRLVAKALAALVEHFCFCAQLTRNASHDDLTGLLNRSIFFEFLEAELNKAARTQTAFSVMMMDLDHFKSINDQYGHAVGDQVLKHFAELLRSLLRKSDIIGRLGGEEFAVILPGTHLQSAAKVAGEILNQTADLAVAHARQTVVHFTVSIGISTYPDFANINALMSAADGALYRAKKNGRNRVDVHQE